MPENYGRNQPAPLIVAIHGDQRNGTSFEAVTDFSRREYNKDALVVYPDGVDVGDTTVEIFVMKLTEVAVKMDRQPMGS